MNRIVAVTLAGVVAMFGTLGGCKKDSTSGGPSGAGAVKIGVTVPLSGNLQSYGKRALDGMRQRVEELNESGGVEGRKIELVVEDNRGDANDTRNSFRKLAQVDKVVAVIGPVTSTNALAIKGDAVNEKLPTLTPTATNDMVTPRSGYVFRACFNDSFQGAKVAAYVLSTGAKKAAVMVDKSSDYSKGLSASFRKAFEAGGGAVVEEGYQQKDTEFGPQLAKIKDSGAEILFVPGYPPEVPMIIQQAKTAGLDCRLCGADGWDNEEVKKNAGDNLVGCTYMCAFDPNDPRVMVGKFVEGFKARYKETPGTFEALGYDSVSMLAEAMKKGAGRQEIRDGLAALKDFEVVTGRITITPDGDASKEGFILKMVKSDGRLATECVQKVSP